jgi:hypothetical protein
VLAGGASVTAAVGDGIGAGDAVGGTAPQAENSTRKGIHEIRRIKCAIFSFLGELLFFRPPFEAAPFRQSDA